MLYERRVVPNTFPLDFDLLVPDGLTFTPEGGFTREPLASVHEPDFG